MIINQKGNRMPFLLASITVIIFCLISYFVSSITFDSGDGIRHYSISRYSFQHPALFLDHWGKPFFILISSPFAQFGMMGMNIFNILCMVGSFFSGYVIANKMKLRFLWLYPCLLGFAPIYFGCINSGLTEPFFGFVLIFAIFLCYEEKYVFSALLISFLPFVRSEGNLILPLFGLLLIYRKKYLQTPLLLIGTLIYSIVGYFHFHDLLWIINQNPYNGSAASIYGHGELFNFITNYSEIFSLPLAALIIISMWAILFTLFRKNQSIQGKFLPEELLLIAGSFLVYFVAHSIFWWKGLFNSYGLIRVIAAVMPCAALLGLQGVNKLIAMSSKLKILQPIILIVCPIWMIWGILNSGVFAIKKTSDTELIDETVAWFDSTEYKNNVTVYLFPYLIYKLNKDPFDTSIVRETWGLEKDDPSKYLPDNSIVFWDSHFSPNEGGLPLQKLVNSPNFTLLKRFKSLSNELFFGNTFEIDVFKKTEQNSENVYHNRRIYSELDSLNQTRPLQIKMYEYRINHDNNWMKEIKRKARSKGLPLDSMIHLDALWMADNAAKK